MTNYSGVTKESHAAHNDSLDLYAELTYLFLPLC